jgi:hypothetical protein
MSLEACFTISLFERIEAGADPRAIHNSACVAFGSHSRARVEQHSPNQVDLTLYADRFGMIFAQS